MTSFLSFVWKFLSIRFLTLIKLCNVMVMITFHSTDRRVKMNMIE